MLLVLPVLDLPDFQVDTLSKVLDGDLLGLPDGTSAKILSLALVHQH